MVKFATTEQQIDEIVAIGKDPVFKVSDEIQFYDREELVEWMNDRKNNLLMVYELPMIEELTQNSLGTTVLGFCFCKIMSKTWAMMDGFYVKDIRSEEKGMRSKIGEQLFHTAMHELKQRGIEYVSCMVNTHDGCRFMDWLEKRNLKRQRNYQWMDLDLSKQY